MSRTTSLKAADPRHGRALPSGYQLAIALRKFFRRQLKEVVRVFPTVPNLGRWTGPMAESLAPMVAPHFFQGGQGALRQIAGKMHSRCFLPSVRKVRVSPGFDVTNPRVADAVRHLTLEFCDDTNNTSVMRLDLALEWLREALAEGLDQGEAYDKLAERVRKIFNTDRARTIAATEATRAVHAGEVMAARDTGVVRAKRWLASADACPICLELDGKEVGLEEDFAFIGKGPYARIPHPPAHPNCLCTTELVIGDEEESVAPVRPGRPEPAPWPDRVEIGTIIHHLPYGPSPGVDTMG